MAHRLKRFGPHRLLFVIALLILASCAKLRNTDNYRWLVKTTTDSDSGSVRFDTVLATTVSEQARLAMPSLTEQSPRTANEDSVYVLEAFLKGFKTEPDGDYHLIIQDTAAEATMLAEIPDPDADWTTRSGRTEQFRSARAALDKIVGKPKSSLTVPSNPVKLRITGIGFFDPPHLALSHEGSAKNGREIHPVLKLEAVE
jgi:hypothetical protein